MREAWEGVPTDIDILITHAPPYKILDKAIKNNGYDHVGVKAIAKYLEKTKAKIHVFGHIHEAKGKEERNGIRFYNVAETMEEINLKL